MKTISDQVLVRRSFKQAQLLPVLAPEMVVVAGGVPAARCVWRQARPTRSARRATARAAAVRLPVPRSSETRAERLLFCLLALSAAVAVGYALVTAVKLTPNWPMFSAWVAQVLG